MLPERTSKFSATFRKFGIAIAAALAFLLHVDLSLRMCLYQVITTLHVLNDVISGVELTRKSIFTS